FHCIIITCAPSHSLQFFYSTGKRELLALFRCASFFMNCGNVSKLCSPSCRNAQSRT
ncbi:unnamed protein product, partial [Amoebophrya sp. A25]